MKAIALFEKIIFPIIIALVGAVPPVWVTLSVYNRGTFPEKQVELTRLPAIDPMHDLSSLSDVATLQIKLADQSVDNVVVAGGMFKNVGSIPIVPGDYVERLSANVPLPWKILAAKTQYGVRLNWKRVNDQRFEAEPALLNPGDFTYCNVYLTNTKYQEPSPGGTVIVADPQVDWQARIINLRSFSQAPDPLERSKERTKFVFVQLGGWWLWITVGMALLSEAVFLHLLARAGFLRKWGWKAVTLIVAATFLSFSAAEAVETYIDGNLLTDLAGINHWLNLPPIILQSLGIALLYLWKPKPKAKRPKASKVVLAESNID